MTTVVITPPAADAVALEEIYDHLRLIDTGEDPDPQDDLLDLLRSAAVEKIEAETGLALISRTLQTTFDCFSERLALPIAPIVSISRITYLDSSGDEQTLALSDFALVDRIDDPGIISGYGKTWPATWDFPGSVTVEYVAGFGDAAEDVPGGIRVAILKTIGGLHEYREDIGAAALHALPEGVKSLIANHIRRKF